MSLWVIVAAIDEKIQFLGRWSGKYKITLSPSPEGLPRWGGIYEDGRPVEKIEAKLLLNEKPEKTIPVEGLKIKIKDRELHAENDPKNENLMLIKMNEHIQGYIPYQKLKEDLRKRISIRPHPLPHILPYATAPTEEIRELRERVGVDPMSAVKKEFDGFKVEVKKWDYQKTGVDIVTYNKNGRSLKGSVTREEPFLTDDNIILTLLYLHLTENSEKARFVLLKYR